MKSVVVMAFSALLLMGCSSNEPETVANQLSQKSGLYSGHIAFSGNTYKLFGAVLKGRLYAVSQATGFIYTSNLTQAGNNPDGKRLSAYGMGDKAFRVYQFDFEYKPGNFVAGRLLSSGQKVGRVSLGLVPALYNSDYGMAYWTEHSFQFPEAGNIVIEISRDGSAIVLNGQFAGCELNGSMAVVYDGYNLYSVHVQLQACDNVIAGGYNGVGFIVPREKKAAMGYLMLEGEETAILIPFIPKT